MTWAGVYGPLVDSADVERAMLAHLAAWMPSQTHAAQAQKDPEGETWTGPVEGIRSYTVRHMAMENWPEDQLPMILAYSPGMDDAPTQNGDGTMDARFALLLLVVSSGYDTDEARANARLYAAAATRSIMQDPSLSAGTEHPFAAGVHLGQVINYPVTNGVAADRFLSAVQMPFVIEVQATVDVQAGPVKPPDDPAEEPEDRPQFGDIHAPDVRTGEDAVEELREGGFFPSE